MLTTRLTLSLDVADGDLVAARLMEDGLAFETRDAGTLERAPEGRVLLSLFVPPAEVLGWRARVAPLVEGLACEWSEEVIDEDAGRDAWKAFFVPRPIGPFVIVPSWESYTPAEGETVIALDPGRAFGTGGHASTRLCLRALGRLTRCARFLDVGSGSGVLAIACALRWPTAIGKAVDNDPEAVAVTRENAIVNQVAERVDAPLDATLDALGVFDVVLGNLTAETLTAIGDAIAARVAPGGRLIASGILDEEAGRVAELFTRRGLSLEHSDAEDEWRALTLVRP